jgi:ketosteroid isomerase-like protein
MTPGHDASAACATFLAAFNSGDLDALQRANTHDAVLVPVPGLSVTGRGLLAANRYLIGGRSAHARNGSTVLCGR